MMRHTIITLAVAAALLTLAACGHRGNGTEPAPINSEDALQQLSKSYTALAAQFPRPPENMPPGERLAFVEQVFKNAGYSYTATLHEMATRRLDFTNQTVIDMAQLLTFPQRGDRSLDDDRHIFTPAQYRDMQALAKRMNR